MKYKESYILEIAAYHLNSCPSAVTSLNDWELYI